MFIEKTELQLQIEKLNQNQINDYREKNKDMKGNIKSLWYTVPPLSWWLHRS